MLNITPRRADAGPDGSVVTVACQEEVQQSVALRGHSGDGGDRSGGSVVAAVLVAQVEEEHRRRLLR